MEKQQMKKFRKVIDVTGEQFNVTLPLMHQPLMQQSLRTLVRRHRCTMHMLLKSLKAEFHSVKLDDDNASTFLVLLYELDEQYEPTDRLAEAEPVTA